MLSTIRRATINLLGFLSAQYLMPAHDDLGHPTQEAGTHQNTITNIDKQGAPAGKSPIMLTIPSEASASKNINEDHSNHTQL